MLQPLQKTASSKIKQAAKITHVVDLNFSGSLEATKDQPYTGTERHNVYMTHRRPQCQQDKEKIITSP